MQLTVLETDATSLRAGYTCPCGCTPSVAYGRGAPVAEEGCCCGNEFAVGPSASAVLAERPGFALEVQPLDAPWGQRLEAAWLVGPSVHGPEHDHAPEHDHGAHDHAPEHDHGAHDHGAHDHDHGAHREHHGHAAAHPAGDEPAENGAAIDPVCGMTVEPETARARGLHSHHNGTDYFFCGKGCKLEFDDDPERYLDPDYVPSM